MSDSTNNNSFRASAWISYDPDDTNPDKNTSKAQNMDQDVDMDAPQISTLREETSPPPSAGPPPPPPVQGRVSKFRVKLKVTEPSTRANNVAAPPPEAEIAVPLRGTAHGEESQEEGTQGTQDSEEEWDQLADDDDAAPSSSVVGTPARAPLSSSSAVAVAARGARGGRGGRGRGRGRGRGATVSVTEPPQTIFEIAPSVAHAEHGTPGILDTGSAGFRTPTSGKTPRKRAKKTDAEKKKPGRKPKLEKASKALLHLQDDAASIASESFVGTAASSPIFFGDASTPDLEPIPLTLPSSIPDAPDAPPEAPVAPITLDPNVPIPIYRLPTKPFLVQPPPKITSGFAPSLGLERGPGARAPVRKWRPALRAVRGIAGGQWFARTWVGEKESAYASATGRDGQGQGHMFAAGLENAPFMVGHGHIHGHGHGHGHGHAMSHAGTGSKGRGSANASTHPSPALSVSKLPSVSAPALSSKPPGRSKLSSTLGASTADSSRSGSVDIAITSGAAPHPNLKPYHPAELPSTSWRGSGFNNMRPQSKMRHTVSADSEQTIDDAL